MNSKSANIIDRIEEIRRNNNINWMNILRIALKHAPEETREELKKINENDKRISNLLSEI